MKPVIAAAAASTEAREEELVARAKAGSSEAFEALFKRYRDRITAYVRTIIPNHARAEDVVQEIFVSALRKLHTLEEPAAFKSWIYEIARNACLDDLRRMKRNGEILVRSNDFTPYDEQSHRQAQSTHGKVSWREQLGHLKEALGGLPESQHEALILREFGGLSYDEIGQQLNLSRPAVESVLFRARRGLKDEYSEIATGKRCRRMQVVMGEIAEGMGGMRDRRLLLRHMRDCGPCRRQATAMGFTGVALPPESGRFRRTISRAAAMLPLPFLFNRRPESSEQVAGSGGSSIGAQAQGLAAQVSAAGNVSADHVSSAIHKAAAVVAAVAVIGGGAGVAVHESGVRIPVLDEGKQGKVKPAAGASAEEQLSTGRVVGPAGSALKESKQSGRAPAAPAGDHDGAVLAPTVASPIAPGTGAPVATVTPESGVNKETTPTTDGSSPLVPGPVTDVPADTGGQSGTGGSTTGGTGTTQGSGSTGSTKPSSSTTGTNPPASSGGQTTPATGGLPPGLQKQIDSGKRSIDDLPPGIAKKLQPAA